MGPLRLGAAIGLFLSAAGPAFGQGTNDRLMRGDVSAAVGWLSINKSELSSYNDWRTEGLFGLELGWYWTNHLKTSVEAAATSATDIYSSGPVVIGGQQAFPASHYRLSAFHFTASQAYQFGDNEWAHPYVSGGIDVVNETTSREDDPVFFYDQATRQSRLLRDRVQHRVRTDVHVRALVSGGVKAYVSQRAFFLTGVRVAFGKQVEDVLWRFGVGVDF